MLYRQDISGCLLERIGALGLGAGELGAFLERTRPSLDRLRDQHAKKSEPLLAISALRGAVGKKSAAERCLALTEAKDNVLRRLARRESIRLVDHDPDIGGRFSVLSNVGVLPALIAGLDAEALRRGAEAVLSETLAA